MGCKTSSIPNDVDAYKSIYAFSTDKRPRGRKLFEMYHKKKHQRLGHRMESQETDPGDVEGGTCTFSSTEQIPIEVEYSRSWPSSSTSPVAVDIQAVVQDLRSAATKCWQGTLWGYCTVIRSCLSASIVAAACGSMGCGQSTLPRPAEGGALQKTPVVDEFFDSAYDTPKTRKPRPIAMGRPPPSPRVSSNNNVAKEWYGGGYVTPRRASQPRPRRRRMMSSSSFRGGSPRVSTSQLLGLKDPSPRSGTPSTTTSSHQVAPSPLPMYCSPRGRTPIRSLSGCCSPAVSSRTPRHGAPLRVRVESRNLGVGASHRVQAAPSAVFQAW
ncbi:hypothetical protein Pmar_PMAR003476 [Perkinsus marinus ATCC 50983]|uniref:Uncharacterized protein n=1 Tax=Perkinsus marinus (strain ATCC 50983 / TXsc) TaxID=423536 RepID=C5KHF1_PERM5|nr:hypothetical protein Pmar_PMAR003476 [Perkinsus marinus ATCC 50983]EER16013.1 hypothetical protein Pmar_PMAR003476 [Perkinsus marinus ATCC 50983]|eukprot:XP_002784217.1 hypothetical protein Pmar_PMAR003476 [Perkinsus marinus ATCC 50983]